MTPRKPGPPGYCVMRGGSWNDGVRSVRCARRLAYVPVFCFAPFGFRPVARPKPRGEQP
jgi:formylglycine-generating enzyme required for sulfatase activity